MFIKINKRLKFFKDIIFFLNIMVYFKREKKRNANQNISNVLLNNIKKKSYLSPKWRKKPCINQSPKKLKLKFETYERKKKI